MNLTTAEQAAVNALAKLYPDLTFDVTVEVTAVRHREMDIAGGALIAACSARTLVEAVVELASGLGATHSGPAK